MSWGDYLFLLVSLAFALGACLILAMGTVEKILGQRPPHELPDQQARVFGEDSDASDQCALLRGLVFGVVLSVPIWLVIWWIV